MTPEQIAELERLLEATTDHDSESGFCEECTALYAALRNAAPALIAAWQYAEECRKSNTAFRGAIGSITSPHLSFTPSESDLLKQITALRESAESAERERDALRVFAQEVTSLASGWCDIDGCELQDLAENHGLLCPLIMTAPCSEESCACAETGADFPTTCYRRTALLTGKERP